jgi:DNA-binding MarR family transcriptional regulator
MTSGKAFSGEDLPDHLLRWADALGRRVAREMAAELPDGVPVPSGRAGRLLQLVPTGGMRITDLAQRASVTKQALGQMVNALESAGLVESETDPGDRRVRRVRRTPRGEEVSAALTAAIEAAEQRLREEVGPRRFDTMKQVMRELGGGLL